MTIDEAIIKCEKYIKDKNKIPPSIHLINRSDNDFIISIIYTILNPNSKLYYYSNIPQELKDLNDYIEINQFEYANEIMVSNLNEFKNTKIKNIITEHNLSKQVPTFKESDIAVELFKKSLTKKLSGKMALRYIDEINLKINSQKYRNLYINIIINNVNISKQIFNYCIKYKYLPINYQIINFNNMYNISSKPIFTISLIKQILDSYYISYSYQTSAVNNNNNNDSIESDLNKIRTNINYQFNIAQDYLKVVDLLLANKKTKEKIYLLEYRQWLIDEVVIRHDDINIWNGYNLLSKNQVIPTEGILNE